MLRDLLVTGEKPSLQAIGDALGAEQVKEGGGILNKLSTFMDRNT